MSRIGKNPIAIPAGVTVELNEACSYSKRKIRSLTQEFSDVTVKIEDGQVIVELDLQIIKIKEQNTDYTDH
jgi:large subunit ribosomal protein L6